MSYHIADNDPIIVTGGMNYVWRRPVPRKPREDLTSGLEFVGSSPIPCFETTYGEWKQLKKNYEEQLVIDLGITDNDITNYIDELFEPMIDYFINGNASAKEEYEKTIPLLQGLSNTYPVSRPWFFKDDIELITKVKAQFVRKISWDVYWNFVKVKSEKAYPWNGFKIRKPTPPTGELLPSCETFFGTCCLYETMPDPKIPGKTIKLLRDCLDDVDRAECDSFYNSLYHQIDGYVIEFHNSKEAKEKGCAYCDDPTNIVHVVFCANGKPDVKYNLTPSQIADISEDNGLWYGPGINDACNLAYFKNRSHATGELRRRQRERLCRDCKELPMPSCPPCPSPTESPEPNQF